jgi:hypothetical protein
LEHPPIGPKYKNPHQDKLIHPDEGLILTLTSYALPPLKRLEASNGKCYMVVLANLSLRKKGLSSTPFFKV